MTDSHVYIPSLSVNLSNSVYLYSLYIFTKNHNHRLLSLSLSLSLCLSLFVSLSLCLGYPSANTKVISIAAYAILKLGPFSKSFGKPGLAVKVTLEPFFWCSNDIRESSKNTKQTLGSTPTKATCFRKRYATRSTYGLYQGTMDIFDGISDVKRSFSLSLSLSLSLIFSHHSLQTFSLSISFAHICSLTLAMNLFSRRRWRLVSAQLSNKFGYSPSINCLLYFAIVQTQPLTSWADVSFHVLLPRSFMLAAVCGLVGIGACLWRSVSAERNFRLIKYSTRWLHAY